MTFDNVIVLFYLLTAYLIFLIYHYFRNPGSFRKTKTWRVIIVVVINLVLLFSYFNDTVRLLFSPPVIISEFISEFSYEQNYFNNLITVNINAILGSLDKTASNSPGVDLFLDSVELFFTKSNMLISFTRF